MEYYKVLMNKMKMQFEDLKEKNKTLQAKVDSQIEELKLADDKNNHNRFNLADTKKKLQDKELEFKKVNDKLLVIEHFASEKEVYEKKIVDHQRHNDNLKRDIE